MSKNNIKNQKQNQKPLKQTHEKTSTEISNTCMTDLRLPKAPKNTLKKIPTLAFPSNKFNTFKYGIDSLKLKTDPNDSDLSYCLLPFPIDRMFPSPPPPRIPWPMVYQYRGAVLDGGLAVGHKETRAPASQLLERTQNGHLPTHSKTPLVSYWYACQHPKS